MPDSHHQHTVTREITLPPRAFGAARWRLSNHNNPDDLDRWRVEAFLMEETIRERFLTPDGRDTMDVLLDHTGTEGGAADD